LKAEDYVTEEYVEALHQEMLHEAEAQNYERAAQLRDEIARLKGEAVATPQAKGTRGRRRERSGGPGGNGAPRVAAGHPSRAPSGPFAVRGQQPGAERPQPLLRVQTEGVVAAAQHPVGPQLHAALRQLPRRPPPPVVQRRAQLLVQRPQNTPTLPPPGPVRGPARDPLLLLAQQIGGDGVESRVGAQDSLRVVLQVAPQPGQATAVVGGGRVTWQRQEQRPA